jgi:hypothetical protein
LFELEFWVKENIGTDLALLPVIVFLWGVTGTSHKSGMYKKIPVLRGEKKPLSTGFLFFFGVVWVGMDC